MNKEKNIVWFGMKVSPDEKKRIKKLAELQGTNQKDAVLQAVEEKIASYDVPTIPGSLLDRLKQHAGGCERHRRRSCNQQIVPKGLWQTKF